MEKKEEKAKRVWMCPICYQYWPSKELAAKCIKRGPKILKLRIPERIKMAAKIDGEGSIYLVKAEEKRTKLKVKVYPVLGITNTNRRFIESFESLGFKVEERNPKNPKWKKSYFARTRQIYLIRWLLQQLLSFLEIKKEQAKLMIEYCTIRAKNYYKSYTEREFEIFEELKKLNKRGL